MVANRENCPITGHPPFIYESDWGYKVLVPGKLPILELIHWLEQNIGKQSINWAFSRTHVLFHNQEDYTLFILTHG
jgi:hypothetical protein